MFVCSTSRALFLGSIHHFPAERNVFRSGAGVRLLTAARRLLNRIPAGIVTELLFIGRGLLPGSLYSDKATRPWGAIPVSRYIFIVFR